MNNNIDIKNLKIAKKYAIALLESSKDNLDEIKSNLESIEQIIFDDESLKAFFLHPVVSLKDKKEIIKESIENKVNYATYNFILTLLDENRFSIFKTILEVFKQEVDKIKNKQQVVVISAVELDENQKSNLKQKLNSKLNKESIINYLIDQEIVGGLIVKYDDKIIDLSLKTKFEYLRKNVI